MRPTIVCFGALLVAGCTRTTATEPPATAPTPTLAAPAAPAPTPAPGATAVEPGPAVAAAAAAEPSPTPAAEAPAATATEVAAPTAAEPPTRHPREILRGRSPPVEIPGQGTAHFFGTIFLKDLISQARGTVYLYLDGVEAAMGTEAEVYLVQPGPERIDPTLYIGSIANVPSGRTRLGTVALEIHDFKADGVRYRARTALRGMRSFAVAILVKQGSVDVERIVVTTAGPSQRGAE